MMNYYFNVLKQYAVFSGRARRKEYWYFALINFIISFIIGFITGFISAITKNNFNFINTIYSLAVLLPYIGVTIRRLHDADKSGWYILMPVYNLVLLCTDSTRGNNRYGSNPKEISFPSDNSDEVLNIPKDENEFAIFIEKNKTLFKSKGSILFYSIIFGISLLLSLIIPFMYITIVQPMPTRSDSISVMNLFSFINIINIIIFMIAFLILKFKDFHENGYNYISKIKSFEKLTIEDQVFLLNNSLKTYYTLKNVMLIVLFIPFWSSLVVSFMHVTGPLVFSHKIYFLNNLFPVLYLIFIIYFFPTSGKTIKYYKDNSKLI